MQESAILKGGESIAADPEDRKGKDWTRVEVAGRGNRGKKRKWRRIESSPLSFSRAPIRVVCLPRGCRQLVEDVAASYRGPRKGPFCRDFSDWWWRFNGAACTIICYARRWIHRLILNNRMEPSQLAAIHLDNLESTTASVSMVHRKLLEEIA